MRLLVAFLLLTPLLSLLAVDFFLSGRMVGIWLVPIALAIALLATEEVLDMLRALDRQPIAWAVYAGVALVTLSAYIPMLWPAVGMTYPANCPVGQLGWPLIATATALGLVLLGEVSRYRAPGEVLANVAVAVFAIVYIGVPSAFMTQLRLFEGNRWGMAALVSVIFVTKLSDVGAYTFGRMMGRHKMTPNLSPGKTWEGAVGGVVVACIASYFYFTVVSPWIAGTDGPSASWWGAAIFGTLVALTGMLGDLSASMLKRDAGRKNSSSWMPGLGGILDVVDSVLTATVPAYLCWVAGVVGPGS